LNSKWCFCTIISQKTKTVDTTSKCWCLSQIISFSERERMVPIAWTKYGCKFANCFPVLKINWCAKNWFLFSYPDSGSCDVNKEERIREQHILWQIFFANPFEWWDRRARKRTANQPDFKHKSTGEALWIRSDDPPWVKKQLDLYDSEICDTNLFHKKDDYGLQGWKSQDFDHLWNNIEKKWSIYLCLFLCENMANLIFLNEKNVILALNNQILGKKILATYFKHTKKIEMIVK
jgi:hypothetical protein